MSLADYVSLYSSLSLWRRNRLRTVIEYSVKHGNQIKSVSLDGN
jgi:hypothetical protein